MADLTDEQLIAMAQDIRGRQMPHGTIVCMDVAELRAFGEAYAKPRESSELVKRLRKESAFGGGLAELCREAADALEQRDGFVSVPREPTEAMRDEFIRAMGGGDFKTSYRAMIAAAEKGE